MIVKDFMKREVVKVTKDIPLIEIARRFADYPIGTLPVIDEENRVVGLITRLEFLDFFLPHSPILLDEIRFIKGDKIEDDIFEVKWKDAKVEDIMIKNVIILKEDNSILKAAAIFYEDKPHGIPVVDKDNRLIGIITQSNICKALLSRMEKRRE